MTTEIILSGRRTGKTSELLDALRRNPDAGALYRDTPDTRAFARREGLDTEVLTRHGEPTGWALLTHSEATEWNDSVGAAIDDAVRRAEDERDRQEAWERRQERTIDQDML